MSVMMAVAAVSAFAKALKAKAQVWKKAAKAEPRKGGGYAPPEVPDGRYEARISGEYGITDKENKPKVPWVRITATISDGTQVGKEPSRYYYLDGKPQQTGENARLTNEEQLAGDLKTLLPDVEVEETLATDPGQVGAMIDELNQRNPLCKIGIRNWEASQGKNKGKRNQDVFFNDLIEGGEASGKEESGEEAGEEESSEGDEEEVEEVTEEEGEVESDEDGESESESDEPVAPTKGDPVMFKPKGATKASEYKVLTVNQRKQTVTLSNGKKKIDNVAWDRLE